jgi:hypothetical protein
MTEPVTEDGEDGIESLWNACKYRGYCRRLHAENERLRALLTRYRNETPLGHQPHMVAHEVDAALKETK